MKETMEIVVLKLVELVLEIVLAVAIIIGICKFANVYMKAYSYTDLTKAEAATMYIVDNARYNDLSESYDFIMSIPLVRDTL